ERQPKHLFHFIIRYEGEGVIDNNVAKVMEGFSAGKGAGGCDPLTNPPCLPPLPTAAVPVIAPDGASSQVQPSIPALPPPPPPAVAPKPAQPKSPKHDKSPKNVG